MKFALIMTSLVLWSCATTTPTDPKATPSVDLPLDCQEVLKGYDAVLLLLGRDGEPDLVHKPEALDRRSSPCSTFKVPHALIALEEAVLPDGVETVLPWNGKSMPIKSWERDHSLKTAMPNSVVWYFQEIARRLGMQKEGEWLLALNYGNADPSSDLLHFWLGGGSLKISPREQVDFWQRLVAGQLPARPENMKAVLDLVELEKGPDGSRLLGKTGSAVLGNERDSNGLGWFVGAVERDGRFQVFALRIEGPGAWGPKAKELMIQILARLGVWPAQGADSATSRVHGGQAIFGLDGPRSRDS